MTRLLILNDTRTGDTHTVAIPPTSPWHALLDDVTEATIRAETPEDLAARAAYAAVGGLYLPSRDPARRR